MIGLAATIDRARLRVDDARSARREWDRLDAETCSDRGELLWPGACLGQRCRQTCHLPDHGDSRVLKELGAI